MTNVSIYTTPSCPYCRQAKKFLDEKNVKYKEFNVADDREKAKEMIEKTNQRGVPVIVVEKDGEEEAVIGFDKKKLKKLLGQSN